MGINIINNQVLNLELRGKVWKGQQRYLVIYVMLYRKVYLTTKDELKIY